MEDVIREEMSVGSFVATCTQTGPSPDVAQVCIQDAIPTVSVLTRKHDNTDLRYFQVQTTSCVNFPWLSVPEEMTVSVRLKQ
jgi:hypothetical protein